MRWQSWVGCAIGVAIVGVAAAQPAMSDPIKPTGATASVTEVPRSGDMLDYLLGEARTAHGKLRDYTGTYTRQERINGSLTAEQVGEMAFRVNPFGVHVRFVRPSSLTGMEVTYSAARKESNKMHYRPAGLSPKSSMRLSLDDAKFLTENRHPITEWGIGPMLEVVATATAREKSMNNPIEVYVADYQFSNRNVKRFEILMRRPHALRYAAKMVVYLDKETKLPLRFESYDEPKSGNAAGDLLEAYSFTDLKFNTGVSENAFDL